MSNDIFFDKVKNILCKHYDLPLTETRLKVSKKSYFGLSGVNKHYLPKIRD